MVYLWIEKKEEDIMKEEWKNIAGSTWIKVVLAAIIVIPMLYSGIFLGSMWDPYGNADKIAVAVVNEDNKVKRQRKWISALSMPQKPARA